MHMLLRHSSLHAIFLLTDKETNFSSGEHVAWKAINSSFKMIFERKKQDSWPDDEWMEICFLQWLVSIQSVWGTICQSLFLHNFSSSQWGLQEDPEMLNYSAVCFSFDLPRLGKKSSTWSRSKGAWCFLFTLCPSVPHIWIFVIPTEMTASQSQVDGGVMAQHMVSFTIWFPQVLILIHKAPNTLETAHLQTV